VDAKTWQQARALFDEVVECPPDEWLPRLERLCDDPALRHEVLRMLEADRAADRDETLIAGLAPDLLDEVARAAEELEVDRWIGQRLGPWRIVRAIGRGGMGTVYQAEREDGEFRQTAAIKMLRGESAPAAVARFLSERQILARLEHPNIARLLDGGTTPDSGPWFALEYIDGTPIDRWCDARRLDVNARLKLFLDVCDAVAYAHDRLIVHRDLKPSNILVAGEGRVSLLDFGIAKLIEPDAGTELTRTAVRTFTPEYASPEQIRGEPITTASDIYALGVVLYELLAGRRPYRVSHTSSAAYERAVTDQDVLRPSAAVTRASADGQPSTADIAGRRGLSAGALRARLRGDLDAIVLRALRKEPERRYRSVREMARDVQAVLEHRPVAARRGGFRYVAGRFVRRNRLAVAMAGVAVAMLVGGLVAALLQAHEARIQRDAARQSLAFMTGLFENADPGTADRANLTVKDVLDRGARDVDEAFPADSPARAELLLAMASAYLGLELDDAAAPLIDESRRIAEASGDPEARARAAIQQCRLEIYRGDYEACTQLAAHAETLLDPAEPAQAALSAELVSHSVVGFRARDDHQAVVAETSRALAGLPGLPEHQYLRSTLIALQSSALLNLGRTDEAERLAREHVHALAGADAPPKLLAVARDRLGSILISQGRYEEALGMMRLALDGYEQLYGVDSPLNAVQMNNLAVALSRTGRQQEAIELLQRVVAVDRAEYGPVKSPNLGRNLGNLGTMMFEAGNPEEALAYLDESVENYRATGTYQSQLGHFLWWRAALHLHRGRLDEAAGDLAASRRILAGLHPPDHPRMLRVAYLAFAMDLLQEGPAALTDANCATARRTVSDYARADDLRQADDEFAGFLASLCDSSDRNSLLASRARFDASSPANDFRRAFAARIAAKLAPT
jgi:hypothetical protein